MEAVWEVDAKELFPSPPSLPDAWKTGGGGGERIFSWEEKCGLGKKSFQMRWRKNVLGITSSKARSSVCSGPSKELKWRADLEWGEDTIWVGGGQRKEVPIRCGGGWFGFNTAGMHLCSIQAT